MNTPHLEMIQTVVNRLAGNSYAYKGWSVTITAGLIAFLVGKSSGLVFAALYPVLAFWFLDAHNLALERAFRKLFDAARRGQVEEFSMDISAFRQPTQDQLAAMRAPSMIAFYVSALICVYVVERGVDFRKVFFSFHYARDCWSVSQIRNSWLLNPFHEAPPFYDKAQWEQIKRSGSTAIRNWIDS